MTKKSSIFFLISIFLFVFVFSSQAMAVTMPGAAECGACHQKYPSDFESYLEFPPINLEACKPCHLYYLGHGDAFIITPYGYFYSDESLNFDNTTTVALIHTVHRRTKYADYPLCNECHVGASCDTCHSSPVRHGSHTILLDGTNLYPGITELYGGGRGNYLVYSATLTCTNEKCHSSMNISFAARPSCLNCHTVNKTRHGDVSAAHTYAALSAGCMGPGCHVKELTGEHEIRTDEAGNPLTCQTCHTSTNPAVQGAITRGDLSCEACHIVVGHRALHEAEPRATGCLGGGCHQNNFCDEHENRTDPATGKLYNCSVCHGPDARQGAKDAIANYKENGQKATCFTCHPEAGEHITVHDSVLPAPYKEQDCSKCHKPNLVNEHDARGLTCDTCHKSTDLVVQNAIVTHNKTCAACHEEVGRTGHYSQHEAYPRIDDPSRPYGTNSCGACHLNNLMDEHPRRRAADGNYLTCDTCHASLDSMVRDAITVGDTNCDACHVIHGNIIAIHESPTTKSGTECGQCHASNLGTEHDKYKLGCSVCHDSSKTTVLAAVDAHDTKCTACHATYHSEELALHTSTTTDCIDCHVAYLPDLHKARGCLVCHDNSPRVNITTATANCYSCHYLSDYPWHKEEKPKHTYITMDSGCIGAGCHTSNYLPDEHQQFYAEYTYPNACALCHLNKDPTRISWATATAACGSCHPEAAAGHYTIHEARPAMATECTKCHKNNLMDEHEARGLTCDTCHKSADSIVQDAIKYDKTNCDACHGEVGKTGHYTQHASVLDSTCLICHKGNAIDEHLNRGYTCDTCHNYTGNKLNPGDVSAAIAVWDKTCGACHKIYHMDLNPEVNASYHPAFAVGTNPMTGFGASLVSPWTPTSITKCTDCHAATSSYPITAKDGSTVYLIAPYPHIAVGEDGLSRPSNMLCFICHTENVYGAKAASFTSGLGKYHKEDHDEYGCYVCHEIHGSSIRRLITYRDAGSGQKWMTSWVQHSGAYQKEDCGSTHPECKGKHDSSEAIKPATITGKVTDGATGTGIQRVKMTADKYNIVAYTDSNGNHKLGNLYFGTYTITASISGYVSQSKTVTLSQGKTVTLNFVLGQPGEIAGKVTDTKGVTIAGVTMETDTGGYTTTTASDGIYKLSNVAPGTYTVTASKTGYSSDSKTVTVYSSQTTTVDFILGPAPVTVYADQALYITKLSTPTTADGSGSKTDITSYFKNGKYDKTYVLQYVSGDNRVVTMRLNKDANLYSKVLLRIYVNSYDNGYANVKIYAYNADANNMNTSASLTTKISTKGWVEFDVTTLAQKMGGFGWMKFRLVTTDYKFTVSEGQFVVTSK